MSPALAGRFLTTRPPGMPACFFLIFKLERAVILSTLCKEEIQIERKKEREKELKLLSIYQVPGFVKHFTYSSLKCHKIV